MHPTPQEPAKSTPQPYIVWQVLDGKPGHENQTYGLSEALARQCQVEFYPIGLEHNGASWLDYLRNRPICDGIPGPPDLVIGTGSRTHATTLSIGRQYGAKTVTLMSPSALIRRRFDLCIVPEHDGVQGPNILTTDGALNRIPVSTRQSAQAGLFLIGGPSKHHHWDPAQLLAQIEAILSISPEIQWRLTTSRRTPAGTLQALQAIQAPNLTITPAEATDREWVPHALQECGLVWVSEDSVSMIYEALSSGARVGVLDAPRKSKRSRILRGIDRLITNRQVQRFSPDCRLDQISQGQQPVNEAERAAQAVLKLLRSE